MPTAATPAAPRSPVPPPSLGRVLRDWGRIGCIGFGGPPAHIALLRELCVERRGWLTAEAFEDGIAACNLLPGPSSTQLAILCAHRVRGRVGALVGGFAFIVPGLIVTLALATLFLATAPPTWVLGAGAGAGAAVAAVALRAGLDLVPGSLGRVGGTVPERARWFGYALVGGVATVLVGPWLVLVLLACGAVEVVRRRRLLRPAGDRVLSFGPLPVLGLAGFSGAALAPLAWTGLKVGALSYGGGFVTIPLMRADAVITHGWMTDGQFLSSVALGQVTPGPVTHTVALVGYAASGLAGGLVASAFAFAPSFLFVLLGGDHFDRLRANPSVRAFLDGAGPAAIGAIIGSAVPLARGLAEPWQFAVLAGAVVLLFAARRGVVTTLVTAGTTGALLAVAGAPLPT